MGWEDVAAVFQFWRKIWDLLHLPWPQYPPVTTIQPGPTIQCLIIRTAAANACGQHRRRPIRPSTQVHTCSNLWVTPPVTTPAPRAPQGLPHKSRRRAARCGRP